MEWRRIEQQLKRNHEVNRFGAHTHRELRSEQMHTHTDRNPYNQIDQSNFGCQNNFVSNGNGKREYDDVAREWKSCRIWFGFWELKVDERETELQLNTEFESKMRPTTFQRNGTILWVRQFIEFACYSWLKHYCITRVVSVYFTILVCRIYHTFTLCCFAWNATKCGLTGKASVWCASIDSESVAIDSHISIPHCTVCT